MIEDKYISTTVTVAQTQTSISIKSTYSGKGDDLWILSLGDWDDSRDWNDNKFWID